MGKICWKVLKLCLKAVFIIKSMQLIRVRILHCFPTLLLAFKRLLRPSPIIPEIEVDNMVLGLSGIHVELLIF